MKIIFLISTILLIGCGNFRYTSKSDLNLKDHSFSYSEITDSSLLSKRTQLSFIPDSVINGKIIGVSDKNLTIIRQRVLDTLSIPFMEIKSFQVSGYPLPYYNRASFRFGFAGTFILLTLPYIISTYNSQTPVSFEQTPELTFAYWVAGILSGFLLSNQLEYSKEEMQNQIVTIYVK